MIYKDAIQSAMVPEKGDDSWFSFSGSYNESLDRLEQIINDVSDMRQVCRDEWCEMNECLLDEASIFAFAISEPHWASSEDSHRLKSLKKRIHDLFAEMKPTVH